MITDLCLEFENTDFKTVSDNENIMQAIINRLNTDLNELDYLYDEYGANIWQFLGKKRTVSMISFIETHVRHHLLKDDRISDLEVKVESDDLDLIILHINVSTSDNEQFNIRTGLNNDREWVEL